MIRLANSTTRSNSLSPNNSSKLKLWFINLGAYNPNELLEMHKINLIVAESAFKAASIAKKNWDSNLKLKHRDDSLKIKSENSLDDCHSIEKSNQWELSLVEDPEKRSQKIIPDFYGYLKL